MPLYKTFGVDLGTSMIKIYSAQNDSILKEKNMIAIRNENQILASGNEAYIIYEKNPPNVSVIEPMAFGKIADINRTEIVLQSLLKEQVLSNFLGIRYILQFRQICLRLKKGLIIQSEIPREKIKFIWLKNRLPMQYHLDFQLIIQAEV